MGVHLIAGFIFSGTVNVWTTFHEKSSSSCWDISENWLILFGTNTSQCGLHFLTLLTCPQFCPRRPSNLLTSFSSTSDLIRAGQRHAVLKVRYLFITHSRFLRSHGGGRKSRWPICFMCLWGEERTRLCVHAPLAAVNCTMWHISTADACVQAELSPDKGLVSVRTHWTRLSSWGDSEHRSCVTRKAAPNKRKLE